MGDLIDLNSPDAKTTIGPKLASPLIPAPVKSTNNEEIDSNSEIVTSDTNYGNRNSLDNNPFDSALHQIVDYAVKQQDPFEIALEKALKYNDGDGTLTPKARGVEFKDDFTPKRRRYSDILKMNKTLDDSLMEAKLDAAKIAKRSLSPSCEDSVIRDLDDTSLLGESNKDAQLGIDETVERRNDGRVRTWTAPRLYVEPPSPNDTSILNQSAMNDSLTESSDNSEESLIKSIVARRISVCIKKGTSDADNIVVPNEILEYRKHGRSMSQGNKSSPRKFRQQRSKSIVESLKAGMGNDDENSLGCMPSFISESSMNKAFLESRCGNDASNVSNLSNISSITRLTSASSVYNSSYSSAASSNRTVNRGFVESSMGVLSAAKNINEISESRSSSASGVISDDSVPFIFKSPFKENPASKDISNLVFKYSRLNVKSPDLSTIEMRTDQLQSVISGGELTNGSISADKLIDVDVFVGGSKENRPSEHSQRQSASSTSSDSVFFDSSTIGRSIIAEANSLAKTFEELATKTGSSLGSSSSDDLINSRPRWNFHQLPVSDDEASTDNLIDLPNSPIKRDTENVAGTETSAVNKSSSGSDAKSERSMIKELETEFIAPEKKVQASTLLMELENIVKSEGNPEAIKLLENLEKALGVNCGSNSELLASCFSTRNDLTKSPRRSDNPLGNENIVDDNNEKSYEDNVDPDFSESLKQLSLSDGKCLQYNLNTEKEINKSDKSLVLLGEKYEQISPSKRSPNDLEDSSDRVHDDSITALKKENQITDDQKMAVEILVGLGKLLTGENKDPMTASVLKNLGRILNVASSNNFDLENAVQTSVEESKRADTPVKSRVATPSRKSISLSTLSRSSNRKSLESSTKTKTPSERGMRRSISGVQTPSNASPRLPIKPLSADKSKAHLKGVKKRFSSDPGFVNIAADKKKSEPTVNTRIPGKEIPLKPISDLAKRDKPSSTIVDTVKSKFRKKIDSDVSSKRGPMKALLPLGNMQRQGSFRKLSRVTSSTSSVTPPKPARDDSSMCAVTTSTPLATVHLSCPTKSPKSKPIASSTPDGGAIKNTRRSAPPIIQSPGKSNLSCNISPVTSKTDEADDAESSREKSKRSTTSRIGTPSKSISASQLPKFSPMLGIKSSTKKSPRGQRRSEPLESFLPRSLNPQKSPSIRITDTSSSLLNNSNKLGSKVKPLNLISKLRRRSASVSEKENYA